MIKKSLILVLLALPLTIWAQPKGNSPYSRFGIGDVADRNFYSSAFMGGLGASFTDPYQINIVNPASIGSLTATTFDMGIFAKSSGLRDGESVNGEDNPYSTLWSGNLGYISLAMPLQNRVNDLLERKKRDFSMATAFTLMPFSTVGYNIAITENIDNIGEVKKKFEGEGGTYQFLWSNGMKYKNFSAGINLGYLFGQIEYARTAEFDNQQPFFNTLFTETNQFSGFLWDFGLIYTIDLGKVSDDDENSASRRINLGLHGRSKTSFTTTASGFEGSIQNGTALLDTLNATEAMDFDGTLPSEIGFGASFYNGQKFALGINYTLTNWSQFDAHYVNNSLNDTYRLSFGGFYRPNYKSISNYFSRIYYRFGFYYNQVPNAIPENFDNSIEDVGVSFGMGLPFFYQRKVSHANLGFSLGLRGRGTAVEERYMRISFSFTFNDDEWFIKRKYN